MKTKLSAILLAIIFGGFGIHKFYLKRYTSFLLYFIFSWTFVPLVLSLIDAVAYMTMTRTTFDRRYNP